MLFNFSKDIQLTARKLMELVQCSANGCYDEVVESLFMETFVDGLSEDVVQQIYLYSDLFITENCGYTWLYTHDIQCDDSSNVIIVADLIMFTIIPKE